VQVVHKAGPNGAGTATLVACTTGGTHRLPSLTGW
jgi:ABC-type cobalamin transport system ATPase subunit